MHEAGLMQEALDLAGVAARQAGAARVHRLRIRVGALSGVVPEALRFAFDALAPGSVAEGGQLELEPVAATYWCEGCRAEFAAVEAGAPCPTCGRPSPVLRSGLELELASMEVS